MSNASSFILLLRFFLFCSVGLNSSAALFREFRACRDYGMFASSRHLSSNQLSSFFGKFLFLASSSTEEGFRVF